MENLNKMHHLKRPKYLLGFCCHRFEILLKPVNCCVILVLGLCAIWYFCLMHETMYVAICPLMQQPSALLNSTSVESNLCLCTTFNEELVSTDLISLEDVISIIDRSENHNVIKCAMTVEATGRLGNLMGEYATLYALAKLNGRPAFQLYSMADILKRYFKVSLPVISKTQWKQMNKQVTRVALNNWMEDSYTHLDGTFVYIYGYPNSWTFYHSMREEILREFQLHDNITQWCDEHVFARIRSSMEVRRQSLTYVGVHVRRTDYVELMAGQYKGTVGDAVYFNTGMNYFRSKFADAVFLVVSDDMGWCLQNINSTQGDVYFVGNNNIMDPIYDFAILSRCNHSVIGVGTFGYWAAYIAGGETVYLYNFTKADSPYLDYLKYDKNYLPNWIPIQANF